MKTLRARLWNAVLSFLKYINQKAFAKGNDGISHAGMQRNKKKHDGHTGGQGLFPRVSREARWRLHDKEKACTLGQQPVLQASSGHPAEPFGSEVWKVLKLHPGSGNKV